MQDVLKMGSGYQGDGRAGAQGEDAWEQDRSSRRGEYGYHEVKEHAGKDFPFNIYPCSIPADFRQVPVHWHEDMEIIAVKKGRGLSLIHI